MRIIVVLCLVTVLSTGIATRVDRKTAKTRGSQSENTESGGLPEVKEKAAKFAARLKEKAAKFGAGVKDKAGKLAGRIGDAVSDSVDSAKAWAEEKAETAKTGKTLADDDSIAELIIAKKMSRDAVNADEKAKKKLDDADSRYLKAAAKSAALAWGTLKIPTGENIESVDYAGLTDQYKERAAALESLQLTDWSSTAAEMSAAEKVALLLLRARRRDMSGNATLEEDEEEEEEEAEDGEDSMEELPWYKRLAAKAKRFGAKAKSTVVSTVEAGKEAVANAKSAVAAGKEAVGEAVDNAKAGKQILDDGGAEVQKVFIVKKCSLQAVDAENIAWKKMQAAHDKYLKAAEMLDAAFANVASPLPADVAPLDKSLPDQYRARAEIIKEAIDDYSTPPPSPAMSGAEMSAMKILMVKSVTGISCSF